MQTIDGSMIVDRLESSTIPIVHLQKSLSTNTIMKMSLFVAPIDESEPPQITNIQTNDENVDDNHTQMNEHEIGTAEPVETLFTARTRNPDTEIAHGSEISSETASDPVTVAINRLRDTLNRRYTLIHHKHDDQRSATQSTSILQSISTTDSSCTDTPESNNISTIFVVIGIFEFILIFMKMFPFSIWWRTSEPK